MSVWSRLFGRSEQKPAASKPRLGLESLEIREVPAVLGGTSASANEFPYQVSVRHAAADSVPTDSFALNYAKIEFNRGAPAPVVGNQDFFYHEYGDTRSAPAPASDYIFLNLDGIDGARSGGGHREVIEIDSWSLGTPAAEARNATFKEFTVTKKTDTAVTFDRVADDVWVDGRIITAENSDSAREGTHGYIRIKKLSSGGG